MSLPAELISQILNPPPARPAVIPSLVIRSTVEDFEVEEIPAYAPSGSGEHGWLWIEKRGLSSPELVKRICTTLEVPSKDVGLAGQKDRHAVTRQFVSLPRRYAERAESLNSDDLRVLTVTAHTNKLKTGHLRGNRFRLVVRPGESATFDEAVASQIQDRLALLSAEGFPNYFGRQRFGHDGQTLQDGLRYLKGRLPKDHWPEHQTRTLQRLSLSSVQSAVFNLVLAGRVQAGTFASPVAGDVVIRRDGIKPFRLPDGGDPAGLVPAGPMPGPEMLASGDDVAAQEAAAMTVMGLNANDFRRFPKLTSGIRRKLVEFPAAASTSLQSDGSLLLAFELSAGTYATTLLEALATEVVDDAAAVVTADVARD